MKALQQGQHCGFLHLESPRDGAFLPRFPFCLWMLKMALQRNWSLPEAKFCPYQTQSPSLYHLSKSGNTRNKYLGPRNLPTKWEFRAVSRRDQEVSDTNESLGMSWNRQGQSQPHSLARHFGKAPSQLCVRREDSGKTQVSVGGAKSSGDPLVQALIWAMTNL